MKILPLLFCLTLIATTVSAQEAEDYTSVPLPNDFVGKAPADHYIIYLDSSVKHNGHFVPTIKATERRFKCIQAATGNKKEKRPR